MGINQCSKNTGMGVPIGEKTLSEIMDRFDSDHDGQIDFEEFESVMREFLE